MFSVNDDMSIHITRGDTAFLRVTAHNDDGSKYIFQVGDVVRFKVMEKKACENVMFYKDFGITEEQESVVIYLTEADTKIGEVISKPTDYWYEIELNPSLKPQTVVGYDDDGAKVFKLLPEGDDIPDTPVESSDIPIVDKELDVTSNRPVENRAVAREIHSIQFTLKRVEETAVLNKGYLLADDGTVFRFGVNEKGEYGYIIKKDGADTVIPFKRAFGNAQPWQVLVLATFTNESGEEKTGTMPNQGAKTASLDCGESYTIPNGYHNGSGKITANSLASQTVGTAYKGNIIKGATAWVNGVEVTGSMTHNGSVKASLDCGESYTIPKGYHTGSGKVTANSLADQTSGTATDKDIFKGKTAWVNGVEVTGSAMQNRNAMDTVIKGGIASNGVNHTPILTAGESSITISNNTSGYSASVEVYTKRNYIVDDYAKLTINFSHFYMPSNSPKMSVYFSESTHTDAGAGDYSRFELGEVESAGVKEFDISGMTGVYHIVFVSALGGGDDSTNNTPVGYTISQLEFS